MSQLSLYNLNIHFSIEHAEADCFFCFTNLMSEIRDFFIKTLDEADCGINNMMIKLSHKLKENDVDVWNRLQHLELRPQYYSFRLVQFHINNSVSYL